MEPNIIIKEKREKLSYTQTKVASLANISLRSYQRFESGERDIRKASFQVGISLCKALELDPYIFLKEK